jgi:menaquinone-dependent protoporphyrinogen oxidase
MEDRIMNVLVAYASKHGSTREIAEVIVRNLREGGIMADLLPARDVSSIGEYDSVIIGSAIYVGQWQKDALDLIERAEPVLKTKRVWLFSSGPIGDDPYPVEEPPITCQLLERTGAIEHQSFTGKLDRTSLGFGERMIATVVRAPEGDFRDWDAIRAWASYIARHLRETRVASTTGFH